MSERFAGVVDRCSEVVVLNFLQSQLSWQKFQPQAAILESLDEPCLRSISVFGRMQKTIGSSQGEIFQLYIIQDKTLDQVIEILNHQKGLQITRKVLNTQLRRWGYTKHYRRSEHLAILRAKRLRESQGKSSLFFRHDRPVDLKKVRAYERRERLDLATTHQQFGSSSNLLEDITCWTPPPTHKLPFAEQWRAPEKFLYDTNVLIRSSFESGRWSFSGNDSLINSSPAQVSELTLLNDFLGKLKIGCTMGRDQRYKAAGQFWLRAFLALEPLVSGQYHNILPNLIQQINDINNQGFTALAVSLKSQIVEMGQARAHNAPLSSALASLGEIDMSMMMEVEQRLMKCFTELFGSYLSPHCYNSFVMMMDTARRRLLQDVWCTFEDYLPAIPQLDTLFGMSDRRPLDVIGLRLEILSLRGVADQALAESSDLVRRAEMIRNDPWQRLYHLVRGWYYLGWAQYTVGEYNLSLNSFTTCLKMEEDLSELDSFKIFEAEIADARRYMRRLVEIHCDN